MADEKKTTLEKSDGAEKKKYESHSERAIREQLKYVENQKTRDYIEYRLLDQIKYYGGSSRNSKSKYQILMTASIIVGALIPITAVFVRDALPIKLLIAILGAAVTAINALLSMYNYRDLWETHRGVRQKLEQILYFYFNDVDIFSEGTQDERDARLINICEEELHEEAEKWRISIRKKSEKTDEEK